MYNGLLCKIEGISNLRDVVDTLYTIVLACLGDEINRDECTELMETLLNEFEYNTRFRWEWKEVRNESEI